MINFCQKMEVGYIILIIKDVYILLSLLLFRLENSYFNREAVHMKSYKKQHINHTEKE
jgi:hypothetical protein